MMKNPMRSLKISTISLCLVLLSAVAASAFGEIRYPDRPLNLRASRSASAKWVGSMYPGQKVRVAFMEDGWVAVFEPGETRASEDAAVGYSNAKYLKPTRGRHEPEPWGELVRTTRNLNVRTGPSLGNSVVEQLESGERVIMDFPEGDWAMIFPPDATIRSKLNAIGFSSAKYLEPAPAEPASAENDDRGAAKVEAKAAPPAEPEEWGTLITMRRKVNLREGRTTGSSYVRTLQPGEVIRVAFPKSGWYAVFDARETRRDEGRALGYALQSLVDTGTVVTRPGAQGASSPEPTPKPVARPKPTPEPVKVERTEPSPSRNSAGGQQSIVIDRSRFAQTKRPDPTPDKSAHGYQYRLMEKSETSKFGETWITLKVFLATTKLPGSEALSDFANTLWEEHRRAAKNLVVLVYLPGMDTEDLSYGVIKFSDERQIELWVRKAALLGTKFL